MKFGDPISGELQSAKKEYYKSLSEADAKELGKHAEWKKYNTPPKVTGKATNPNDKRPERKPKAIIVGNPDYVNGEYKPKPDSYYKGGPDGPKAPEGAREKKQSQAQGSGGKDRQGTVKSNNDRKNDNRTGKSGSNARPKSDEQLQKYRDAADRYNNPNKKHFPVEPKKPRKPKESDLIKKPSPKPEPIRKKPIAPEPIKRKDPKPVPGGSKRPAPSIRIDNRNTNINNQSQSQGQGQGQKQESGRKMKDRRSRVDRIKDRAARRVDRIEGRKERRAERRQKIGAAKSKVVGAIDNARGAMARRQEARKERRADIKGAKSAAKQSIREAKGKPAKRQMGGLGAAAALGGAAGSLMQNSDNPTMQKIGKGLSTASNVAGAVSGGLPGLAKKAAGAGTPAPAKYGKIKAKKGTLKEPTNAGLKKLPKNVRNKMGFKKAGGMKDRRKGGYGKKKK